MNGINLYISEQEHHGVVPPTENKVYQHRDRLFIKVHNRTVRRSLHDVLWVEAYN